MGSVYVFCCVLQRQQTFCSFQVWCVFSMYKKANSFFISMQETVQVRDAADGPDLHRSPAGPPTAQKLILGNRIWLLIFVAFAVC